MNEFLHSTHAIDWQHPAVLAQAHALAQDCHGDDEAITRNCFLWVRDEVRHSRDFRIPVVTFTASEVLQHRTGYCYAKSHLLAALLRANGIPAALCYQRLQVSDTDLRFTLHGLNAVHLRQHGWYRLDARGNKPGVNAAFNPPAEQLAFPPTLSGERDLPGHYADPLPEIVELLTRCQTADEVYDCLPDIQK
ncbi:MAG TPA: transglutaminase family protein [Verrucomicrobiae bacterium]